MTDWTKATEKECRAWCKDHNLMLDVWRLDDCTPMATINDSHYPLGLYIRVEGAKTRVQAARMACAAAETREGGE